MTAVMTRISDRIVNTDLGRNRPAGSEVPPEGLDGFKLKMIESAVLVGKLSFFDWPIKRGNKFVLADEQRQHSAMSALR